MLIRVPELAVTAGPGRKPHRDGREMPGSQITPSSATGFQTSCSALRACNPTLQSDSMKDGGTLCSAANDTHSYLSATAHGRPRTCYFSSHLDEVPSMDFPPADLGVCLDMRALAQGPSINSSPTP